MQCKGVSRFPLTPDFAKSHSMTSFCRAEAPCMSHGGRQPLHTSAVWSAQCRVPVAEGETGMRVLPAFCRPCAPDVLISHVFVFLPLCQEGRSIVTTRNRVKLVHDREEVADGTLG